MAVDDAGNVYVTGKSIRSVYPDYDYATVKYNSAGQQQRALRYNGPANGDDEATAIAVDNSGHVYVTGLSQASGVGYDCTTIIRFLRFGRPQSRGANHRVIAA